MPVHLVEGAHESTGREPLAREWFDLLAAPCKAYLGFENSGHTPPYDEPGRFAEMMSDVLTATRTDTSEPQHQPSGAALSIVRQDYLGIRNEAGVDAKGHGHEPAACESHC